MDRIEAFTTGTLIQYRKVGKAKIIEQLTETNRSGTALLRVKFITGRKDYKAAESMDVWASLSDVIAN